MKKLTAGIFASLLAVVATGAAHAEIASKGYVDDINTTLTSAIGAKADTTTVTALDTRVKTAEGEIDALQTTTGQHTSQISTINSTLAGKVDDAEITDMQVKTNMVKTAGWADGKTDDTKYPSAAAVNDAITAATKDIASSTTVKQIQTDLDAAELEIDSLQTDVSGLETSKQNANLGAEAANHIVTTDGTGNITSSATIEAAKVDGLSTVATTGAYGDLTGTPTLGTLAAKNTVATADIDNNAVTTAKIGNAQVTKEKIAAGVIPSVSEQLTTGNTAAAQAGAVADALAGKLDTDGTAARATADASGNVITATYATKAEISDLATDENLALKQDKTDNTLTTTAKTVVGAIDEVKKTADGASTAAGAAQEAADAAQADATQAIEDAATAQAAAEAAQTAADSKLATATYNSQVGTVSATNMGTTATTVVTAIKEVAGEASTAQSTATAAQQTANAAIPAPTAACADPDNKCVLVSAGAGNYSWEVIARGSDGE